MATVPGVELHPGEEVVEILRRWRWIVFPAYIFTLGLFHLWWRRCYLAMTTERVLYGRGIVFIKAQRALPLSRIQDATYKRTFISGSVEVSTAGGGKGVETARGLRPVDAKRFAARVQSLLRRHTGTGVYEEPPHRTPAPTSVPTPTAPAGWYADPYGAAPLRYWSGTAWTEHVHHPEQQPSPSAQDESAPGLRSPGTSPGAP